MKTALNAAYPGYVFHDDGTVYSEKTDKFLTPRKNGANGHPAITIAGKSVRLARVIAEAFLPAPHGGRLIYHDGNPWNCAADNLGYNARTIPLQSVPVGMKAIPDSAEYFVCPAGKVYSTRSRIGDGKLRECLQFPDSDGYLQVTIWVDGKPFTRKVHVLVATVFCPGQDVGLQVRHLDGNKLNVAASNLQWGTALENADDRDRHGMTHRQYDPDTVSQAARSYHEGNMTKAAVAAQYGIGIGALQWKLRAAK